MTAANHGHEPLASALLRRGADPNQRDSSGATALTYAARQGHKAVVVLLVMNGAKIGGATPQAGSMPGSPEEAEAWEEGAVRVRIAGQADDDDEDDVRSLGGRSVGASSIAPSFAANEIPLAAVNLRRFLSPSKGATGSSSTPQQPLAHVREEERRGARREEEEEQQQSPAQPPRRRRPIALRRRRMRPPRRQPQQRGRGRRWRAPATARGSSCSRSGSMRRGARRASSAAASARAVLWGCG
mmetsp:Transcript_25061/g.81851  ORF Transcript_25061/g.81851 Transcript_25061/m.81851 type:complete len:242 (+) Transcript_25061:157-882(+)